MRQVMKCDESPIIALNISFSYERYLSSPLSALTAVFRSPHPGPALRLLFLLSCPLLFLETSSADLPVGEKSD